MSPSLDIYWIDKMDKAMYWVRITKTSVGIWRYTRRRGCQASTLAIRASSLGPLCTLSVAISVDYSRLYVASAYIIIGTMMDHGVGWSSRKVVSWWSYHRDEMLILVIFYPGKPRCITPIILHFILCLCIKFKGIEWNPLVYTYIHILRVLLVW
jgi:hypothetical protein